MLQFDDDRSATPPRDAATLVLVRDASAGVQVFCVKRHERSGFLGGAVVFPGGKLDEGDRSPAWASAATPPQPAAFAPDPETERALAVTACRETLEEAAILPLAGAELAHEELLVLRERVAGKPGELLSFLAERSLRLDLAALVPFARWITPMKETRRYDTRFFLTVVGAGQRGAHDEHETTASFWAAPQEVLARFEEGALQLAPPTHRMLTLLSGLGRAEEAVRLARDACLEPICPRLVRQKNERDDTVALVLPGDPEHEVRELRVPGPTRFVLRGDRWQPEDPV